MDRTFGAFQTLFFQILSTESGRFGSAGIRFEAGESENVHPTISSSISADQEDAVSFDDRQLFDLNGFIENHSASAALFHDKDAGFRGQDETMIRPGISANDFVVEIRIETLRLPRLSRCSMLILL